MKKELFFGILGSLVVLLISGWYVYGYKKDQAILLTDTKPSTNSSTTSATKISLTLSEIAKHNSNIDCWLVVQDKVYNVTSYIDQHPGGRRVVVSYCGQDATNVFIQEHNSSAFNVLNKFLLGSVGALISESNSNPVNVANSNIKNSEELELEDD